MGQLPKQLIINFLDKDAFNRKYTQNPFTFKHYNIHFVLCMQWTNTIQASAPIQAGNCVKEYMNLVQTFGKHGNIIHGYALFVFNLSLDQEYTDYYLLIKTGNLRAEICFTRTLLITVNMVVGSIFNNVIEINQWRCIPFDYMWIWRL